MKIPKPITNLVEAFHKLPGIGPKSAQRLTYYLLHVPQSELDSFASALTNLKKNTVLCSLCKNVSESDPCPICLDVSRDQSTILVVEQPLDVLAFERGGQYKGLYHVLHGAINPLDNIGPDEIFIQQLFDRISDNSQNINVISEIIIATNPTMEGEATSMYISQKLKTKSASWRTKVKVSRMGMGIPTGADIEFADDITLRQSLEGRREL